MYYRSAEGGLIVADITRKETLQNIPGWIAALQRVSGVVRMIFLANKIDLQGQQAFKEGAIKAVANEHKSEYFLTSAKTGQNVETAFQRLAEKIIGDFFRKQEK